MIDQLLGRPSPSLRRTQVFIVLFFWIWRLYKGDGASRPFPSRTQSAVAPGPSGLRGKKVGGKAGRSWIWRLWIQLVGKRAVAWMGKLNERLSRLFYAVHRSRSRADVFKRKLFTLSANTGHPDTGLCIKAL